MAAVCALADPNTGVAVNDSTTYWAYRGGWPSGPPAFGSGHRPVFALSFNTAGHAKALS
jgi:hypothetical protein